MMVGFIYWNFHVMNMLMPWAFAHSCSVICHSLRAEGYCLSLVEGKYFGKEVGYF